MTPHDDARYQQLLQDGFCIFENLVDSNMLANLRKRTDQVLDAQDEDNRRSQRTTGSMYSLMQHPFFAEIITYRPALDALARLGYRQPTFSDGYIISKPPHSPRLFWHYDWFAWEERRNYQPEPPQVFLMYYLQDTRRENGCLRVIPGSHYRHNPLHEVIDEPHSPDLQAGSDLTADDFSDRPDEIDVPIKAGDLLIGDSRLLHATHANASDQRRTVLTLWYQTDLRSLPEKIQAQMVAKTQKIPADWDDETRARVEAIMPTYEGSAVAHGRQVYPARRLNP